VNQVGTNKTFELIPCNQNNFTREIFANYNSSTLWCLQNQSDYELRAKEMAYMKEKEHTWTQPCYDQPKELEIRLLKCVGQDYCANTSSIESYFASNKARILFESHVVDLYSKTALSTVIEHFEFM